MEEKILKEKMMNLWKKTFQDSNQYISLIFDNYFNPDYIAYKEENGNLISCLLGIPYSFRKGSRDLRALYLCGLSTKAEYRNNGIMEELLDDINSRAEAAGFAFTFLIPASDSLINYYSKKKYEKAIYRIEDRYTNIHDFENDYKTSIENDNPLIVDIKMKFFDNLRCEYLLNNDSASYEKIITFIQSIEENSGHYLQVQHSKKDLSIVIEENDISGGKIAYATHENGEICGVAFIEYDEHKRIIIKRIYSRDTSDYYKILDFISKSNPDSPLSVFRYPEETDRKALIMKVYGASNPDGGMLDGQYGIAERVYKVNSHAKPYGMVRVTNCDEILKFLTEDRKDLKFSILITEDLKSKRGKIYYLRNGKVSSHSIEGEKFEEERKRIDSTVLTKQEFFKILFRKKETTNLIMEAFGIPRIIINMALLLD